MPSPTPASRVMPIDWSTRPSSSMATHSEVKSPPLPPYSSGTTSPNRPSSPIARTTSSGKVVLAVPLGDVRGDLALGEVAHDLAERLVVVADSSNVSCRHSAWLSSLTLRQRQATIAA